MASTVCAHTQPATVVCKMEPPLEYVHIAHMFLHVWRRFVCSIGDYLKKILLRRNLIKSSLLVGHIRQFPVKKIILSLDVQGTHPPLKANTNPLRFRMHEEEERGSGEGGASKKKKKKTTQMFELGGLHFPLSPLLSCSNLLLSSHVRHHHHHHQQEADRSFKKKFDREWCLRHQNRSHLPPLFKYFWQL